MGATNRASSFDVPGKLKMKFSACPGHPLPVRLVNACQCSFRDLVRGALVTGCRYSELARLRVFDFNADVGSRHDRQSDFEVLEHGPSSGAKAARTAFAHVPVAKSEKLADADAIEPVPES